MEPQLHFLTLATENLDAARAFYKDGLGWTPLLDVPGEIIFFQIAPGLTLGFFDARKFAEDLGDKRPVSGASGVTLSHNVESQQAVDATIGRLLSVGARLIKHPQKSAFGGIYHGHVSDPNGVTWEIAYNPGWRIDDDGKVIFG
ncbi:MAG TPA: VOC family protein [Hyphomicrobiaceae bacterium]|nr:VOC family protein [Hyphomicrobiaceae bacterium]